MKNIKYTSLLFALCLLIAAGCGTDNKKAEKSAVPAPKAEKAVTYKNANPLPSVPKEKIQELWEKGTLVDYIFHNLPFSMSQDEPESIRTNLNYISPEPQEFIPSDCKPIGRQFFQIAGDIVLEADLYFSETCKFYVFVENEKPVFANKMNQAGQDFLQGMISQASGAQKQMQQQAQ